MGIAGAGVIGLAIARELALRGKKVLLVDKGKAGAQASYASGGMIRPITECEHNQEYLDSCMKSSEMYKQYAEDLKTETGVDIEYRVSGHIKVAMTAEDEEYLKKKYETARKNGVAAELLSKQDVKQRIPFFSDAIRMGLYLPNEHQVNNRKLVDALLIAVKKNGVILREDMEVADLSTLLDSCSVVINCAGAWASSLSSQISVKPIRGQMIRFDVSSLDDLGYIISHHPLYLIPRNDKTLVVGSTVEDVGFDSGVSKEGMSMLKSKAIAVLPELANCPIIESWAGLRPKGEDYVPLIGKLSDRVFCATGHYRNGILLAPLTAQLAADVIIDDTETGIFDPRRFS